WLLPPSFRRPQPSRPSRSEAPGSYGQSWRLRCGSVRPFPNLLSGPAPCGAWPSPVRSPREAAARRRTQLAAASMIRSASSRDSPEVAPPAMALVSPSVSPGAARRGTASADPSAFQPEARLVRIVVVSVLVVVNGPSLSGALLPLT